MSVAEGVEARAFNLQNARSYLSIGKRMAISQ
jgi:hypothetical protein